MKASVKNNIEIVLTLSEEEALFLMNLLGAYPALLLDDLDEQRKLKGHNKFADDLYAVLESTVVP